MTLNELKKYVDALVERGNGEKTIRITTKDTSVGARASVGISGIYAGMDWEHGQIRVTPEEGLVKYGKDRDTVMEPNVHVYEYPGGRKSTVFCCKRCGSHLRKADRFCSQCGQKIKEDKHDVVV